MYREQYTVHLYFLNRDWVLVPFDTTFHIPVPLFPQPLPACEAAQGVVEAQRNRPRLKRAVSAPTRVNRDACGVAAAFF